MIAVTEYLVNEEIRDREVRLIGENGEQLGIMSSAAALNIAVEKDLDLVKIAPGSNPPVCKIMDYGKYRFEQSKREKEARKNQRVIEIKEIRMSPSIGENDFLVKLKNGQKFLADGDRVKVTVRFRGARWRTPTSASSFFATLPPSAPSWRISTSSRSWRGAICPSSSPRSRRPPRRNPAGRKKKSLSPPRKPKSK